MSSCNSIWGKSDQWEPKYSGHCVSPAQNPGASVSSCAQTPRQIELFRREPWGQIRLCNSRWVDLRSKTKSQTDSVGVPWRIPLQFHISITTPLMVLTGTHLELFGRWAKNLNKHDKGTTTKLYRESGQNTFNIFPEMLSDTFVSPLIFSSRENILNIQKTPKQLHKVSEFLYKTFQL